MVVCGTVDISAYKSDSASKKKKKDKLFKNAFVIVKIDRKGVL